MKKNCNLTIKLGNNEPDAIVVMENDGVKTQKIVSIDDLASSLASSHKLSTGVMPKGTRYYSGCGTNYIICIETAQRKRIFTADFYNRREYAESKGLKYSPNNIEVPFPSTLFVFHVVAYKLVQSRVFSLKQTLIKEDDIMCRFPFGNTHHQGLICWGYNKLPTIKKTSDLIEVMSMFLDSPFNGDLVDAHTVNSFKYKTYNINDFWSLMKYLPEMERFPEEALYPMKYKFNAMVKEVNQGE